MLGIHVAILLYFEQMYLDLHCVNTKIRVLFAIKKWTNTPNFQKGTS